MFKIIDTIQSYSHTHNRGPTPANPHPDIFLPMVRIHSSEK